MTRIFYWRDGQWVFTLIMIVLLAAIPAGIFLGLYYDQPWWFLMTAAAFIFFYAG